MRTRQILWVLFKTVIFTIFVPGTVALWIPRLVGGPPKIVISLDNGGRVRLMGSAALFLIGALMYLWCAWDFSVKGLGTPAPIDAPKKLVVNGLYRFVRNPMYVGVSSVILAQAIARISLPILTYLALFLISVNLFVAFYEERHLRRAFGEQYEDYCRNVRRWIPRLTAYRPPTT